LKKNKKKKEENIRNREETLLEKIELNLEEIIKVYLDITNPTNSRA